jgi:hypothetical protein
VKLPLYGREVAGDQEGCRLAWTWLLMKASRWSLIAPSTDKLCSRECTWRLISELLNPLRIKASFFEKLQGVIVVDGAIHTWEVVQRYTLLQILHGPSQSGRTSTNSVSSFIHLNAMEPH